MNIFKLPFMIGSVFNWVFPAIETAKDIDHALSGGSAVTMFVPSDDLEAAKAILRANGVKVVSETVTPFHSESGIDISAATWEEVQNAINHLAGGGADSRV